MILWKRNAENRQESAHFRDLYEYSDGRRFEYVRKGF